MFYACRLRHRTSAKVIAQEDVIAKCECKVVGGYKVNFDPDVTSVNYLIEATTLAGQSRCLPAVGTGSKSCGESPLVFTASHYRVQLPKGIRPYTPAVNNLKNDHDSPVSMIPRNSLGSNPGTDTTFTIRSEASEELAKSR